MFCLYIDHLCFVCLPPQRGTIDKLLKSLTYFIVLVYMCQPWPFDFCVQRVFPLSIGWGLWPKQVYKCPDFMSNILFFIAFKFLFSMAVLHSSIILLLFSICRSWECQAGTSRRTGLQHQHNPPQVEPPLSLPASPPALAPTHHQLLVAGKQPTAEVLFWRQYFPSRVHVRSRVLINLSWHCSCWRWIQGVVPAESCPFSYYSRGQQSHPQHWHGRKWGGWRRREVELLWNSVCSAEVPHWPRLG